MMSVVLTLICVYMCLYEVSCTNINIVFICVYMYLYVFICVYMCLYMFICVYMKSVVEHTDLALLLI